MSSEYMFVEFEKYTDKSSCITNIFVLTVILPSISAPVRRIQKRYLDDNTVPVPQSTQYRWKKSKLEHKNESVARKSLPFDKTGITAHAESSFHVLDEINTHSDSSEGYQHAQVTNIDQVDVSEDDNRASSIDSISSSCGDESGEDSSSLSEAEDELRSLTSDDDKIQMTMTRLLSDLSCNAANLAPQAEQALKMLSCFLRNNMSASTCKDILRTLKEMYPDIASVQNLTYDNIWKFVDDSCVKEYHYCLLCKRVFPEDCDAFACESEGCNGYRYKGPFSAQSKKGRQPRQSFVFADVKAQLTNLLQSPGIWSDIQEKKSLLYYTKRNTGIIEDITDGESYQKLRSEGEFLSSPHNVTAVLNTDGVNLYSSSRIEFRPIFLAINELSPAVRFARDNMILVGIWQGKGKPPFQNYLKLLCKADESSV
ncbi:LOW QUALITY PROTEIN: uncharacterized protein LOC124275121 [Haliotis rubra]|uniref:LOW QUALITY PROTEIN: uncharacterized protein LOC124275121 n=1 Tax=Haliotis rubra TaxID=36100 RepID=UPI001EE6017C|nr:LOW QUALITY PROTEIN: uncharacterized protein LOC124275121 [Haliotis rubra]